MLSSFRICISCHVIPSVKLLLKEASAMQLNQDPFFKFLNNETVISHKITVGCPLKFEDGLKSTNIWIHSAPATEDNELQPCNSIHNQRINFKCNDQERQLAIERNMCLINARILEVTEHGFFFIDNLQKSHGVSLSQALTFLDVTNLWQWSISFQLTHPMIHPMANAIFQHLYRTPQMGKWMSILYSIQSHIPVCNKIIICSLTASVYSDKCQAIQS